MRRRPFEGQEAFWVIWAGLLVSFTGSGLTRFGVSVWVFQETRDPQAFAALLFFAVIPIALGSLVAGPLIDRWDRRMVLIVSNVVASVPTLVVVGLLWFGDLHLWHLYVALFVNGLANAFVLPAFDSSIRLLVAPRRLGQASGFAQLIQTLGLVIAPPIAGVLMLSLGLGAIFLIDAVTAAVAVVSLLVVTVPRPAPDTARTSLWHEFVLGLRYVAGRPPFVFLLVHLGVVVFASAFTYALSGPIVLSFGDESTIGLVYAAYGVGSVVGALLVGVTGGTRPRMHGIIMSAFVMSAGTVLTSLRPDALWIGLGVFVAGMAQAVLIASDRTIYQEHVALRMLGRVFSFRSVIITVSQAFGLLTAGWLAAHVFEGAMMPGGALAERLAMFGTGPGRGSAVMLLGTGAVLCCLALIAAAFPAIRRLESRLDADALVATAPAGATSPRTPRGPSD